MCEHMEGQHNNNNNNNNMAAPIDETGVDLGFLEKTDSWRLKSHFFPNKIGGTPSWLILKQLPNFEELKCQICGKPTVFLLQVYAPVNELNVCFHRTIFVFICKDPSCCQLNSSQNIVVFRSQLPRRNQFYSYYPPNEEKHDPELECSSAAYHQNLCVVCGSAGPKKCSKCHQTCYCGKEHQTLDWKSGHKSNCGKHDKSSIEYMFPEYELVMEAEDYEESEDAKSEKEKLEEYKDFLNTKATASGLVEGIDVDKDLETMAKHETTDDKMFLEFKHRIRHEAEQVLRYDRGGEPLWLSSEHIPKLGDIPNCICGAQRQFEFQVLPQMLSQLNVDSLEDSIDWGTMAVYTCKENCDQGHAYKPEFIWKQDITNHH